MGFKASPIKALKDDDGEPYFLISVSRKMDLLNIRAVFAASAALDKLGVAYEGWGVE